MRFMKADLVSACLIGLAGASGFAVFLLADFAAGRFAIETSNMGLATYANRSLLSNNGAIRNSAIMLARRGAQRCGCAWPGSKPRFSVRDMPDRHRRAPTRTEN